MASPDRFVVASDVGGTFTDTILFDREDGRVWSAKSATRPRSEELGVVAGLKTVRKAFEDDVARGEVDGVSTRDLSGLGPVAIHHGSTVATNALLERRGAKTAFITNAGFEDLLAIRRQDRADLYDLSVTRPEPLVPKALRFGVPLRRGPAGEDWSEGEVESALDGIIKVLREVEAIAVGLLHADLWPDDERRVRDHLRDALPGVPVVTSHEVWPEMREVERFETTVANAYLMPLMGPYLERLDAAMTKALSAWGGARPARVMDSAGALRRAADAARLPASLLLSGPAGGVRAAAGQAKARKVAEVVSFDVGGTSTDVAYIVDGAPRIGTESRVGGFACRFPAVGIHTLGAGGGSRLWRDAGGHLQVGPESQGAVPGPACYGRGGEEPTLTDALLLAGRIPPGLVFGERTRPDRDAAWRVVERLAGRLRLPVEEVVLGAVRVVTEAMAGGVRVVTTHRGHDPRGATVVAFGGAGPLLAAELADALGAAEVLVPWDAGTWSARGMATAPVVERRARGLALTLTKGDTSHPFAADWSALASGLEHEGAVLVGRVAMRYAGQSHELEVPVEGDAAEAEVRAAFRAAHLRSFGHVHDDRPLEAVRLLLERVESSPDPGWGAGSRAGAPRPEGLAHEVDLLVRGRAGPERSRARVVWRTDLAPGQAVEGPLVVPDPTATTYVPPHWRVHAERADGSLRLTRTTGGPED
ncbi:MAG: hydantoinase/oxoprolinase family protein [Euryarchaeota archaeon]|nr:hydantoinase/oxoprolinase family protein [Euryarchaeota archaeon]